MDSAIPISAINDFLFCPKSLYLHGIYSTFETSVYHDTPQTAGAIAHENIEDGRYTTSKNVLQAAFVYSARLGLKGKIDLYDRRTGNLVERKRRLTRLYDGFRYQLYAQMYCLEEAGYPVKRLFIQSFSDNKRYEIPRPTKEEKRRFEAVVSRMKNFDAADLTAHSCPHCADNIYGLLNW